MFRFVAKIVNCSVYRDFSAMTDNGFSDADIRDVEVTTAAVPNCF